MNIYAKPSLLLFSAAALLVAYSPAQARDREVESYLQRADAAVTAKIAESGVKAPRGLTATARVDSVGRLKAIRVVQSSGSRETDEAAVQALRSARVSHPPQVLVGGDLNVAIGPAQLHLAKAP